MGLRVRVIVEAMLLLVRDPTCESLSTDVSHGDDWAEKAALHTLFGEPITISSVIDRRVGVAFVEVAPGGVYRVAHK